MKNPQQNPHSQNPLSRVIIGIITLPLGFVVSDSPRAKALGHCLRPQSSWAR